jgi:UPF0716 protein FxsA
MFGRLLLLFTVVPLAELFILIQLGTAIGALPTIAIVIVTGIVGASLARREGFGIWRKIQGQMQEGMFPADVLLDGLLVLVAGALLVTPGIITDVVGFMALIPATRRLFKGLLKRQLQRMMERGQVRFTGHFRTQHMRRVDPETGEWSEGEDEESRK